MSNAIEITGHNVLTAAKERLMWIFDTFDKICLSFSGGKDSTVLYHLAAEISRIKRKKFSVLFIDWEVQYNTTIRHVENMKMMYQDVTEMFYWVALPLTTVNATSQYKSEWICWEDNITWVRPPPVSAITRKNFFPFYQYAMTFEEFIPSFSLWFSEKRKTTVILTGVRANESLNRYIGLASRHKLRYANDKPWTTASSDGFYYTAYPLYDWDIKDVWIYSSLPGKSNNPLYNSMFQAGVSLCSMRVCEPFGNEQRKGLWLYQIIEPETWNKIYYRVSGASSGARYGNERGVFYAVREQLSKPDNHTWQSFAIFLLQTMPKSTSEHYSKKIKKYIKRYNKNTEYYIPDYQPNDLGYKNIPSWRRICKALLKNDFWCKSLSFAPPRKTKRNI